MSGFDLTKYVTPWRFRREQDQRRLAALRERDGDNCRRCRRPMRFDLPDGHDRGPTVERVLPLANGAAEALDNLCLTHRRCNAAGADNTGEVKERVQRKGEAALFARKRG